MEKYTAAAKETTDAKPELVAHVAKTLDGRRGTRRRWETSPASPSSACTTSRSANPRSGCLETSGSQSTSGVPGNTDLGCEWTETPGTLAATLKIPGLRGQPAMALNIDLTDSTFVVTVFGMQVWSSVLKGLIDPSASTWSVEEGSDMTPLVQVELKKATAGRWGGLIDSIGVDSVLQ